MTFFAQPVQKLSEIFKITSIVLVDLRCMYFNSFKNDFLVYLSWPSKHFLRVLTIFIPARVQQGDCDNGKR